ncbi:hypothetical protein [Rathayibacter sp. VKM Ac-2760]|uniref:hypothetical protein n=1 Tax=Rathayibacter sp. VKM Ac-2760 TaxID=2609253 RepID=UPI001FC9932C|nr:hypothetical protein [Rathayibacter sp. VKM Ac-2760]
MIGDGEGCGRWTSKFEKSLGALLARFDGEAPAGDEFRRELVAPFAEGTTCSVEEMHCTRGVLRTADDFDPTVAQVRQVLDREVVAELVVGRCTRTDPIRSQGENVTDSTGAELLNEAVERRPRDDHHLTL